MVPINPTNQSGNFPPHRNPGGIQWMALLRSAMLLRIVSISPLICLRSCDRLDVSLWTQNRFSRGWQGVRVSTPRPKVLGSNLNVQSLPVGISEQDTWLLPLTTTLRIPDSSPWPLPYHWPHASFFFALDKKGSAQLHSTHHMWLCVTMLNRVKTNLFGSWLSFVFFVVCVWLKKDIDQTNVGWILNENRTKSIYFPIL